MPKRACYRRLDSGRLFTDHLFSLKSSSAEEKNTKENENRVIQDMSSILFQDLRQTDDHDVFHVTSNKTVTLYLPIKFHI